MTDDRARVPLLGCLLLTLACANGGGQAVTDPRNPSTSVAEELAEDTGLFDSYVILRPGDRESPLDIPDPPAEEHDTGKENGEIFVAPSGVALPKLFSSRVEAIEVWLSVEPIMPNL